MEEECIKDGMDFIVEAVCKTEQENELNATGKANGKDETDGDVTGVVTDKVDGNVTETNVLMVMNTV